MGSQKSKRPRAWGNILSDETEKELPEDLNPISCETCRQRKCKCDRKLYALPPRKMNIPKSKTLKSSLHSPHCSQCSSEPSRCVYPESGKRGLPLGYLNQLEQRLAETEAAFYGALVTLRNLRNVPIVQPATKADEQRPKSTRMEEWSKLPLRNWPDMEHWMNQTSDQFTLNNISSAYPVGAPRRGDENPIGQHDNRTRSSVDGEIEEIPTPYTWQSQNEVSMRSPYENHSYPQAIGSSPGYVHDAVGSGTAGVAPSLSGDPDDSLVMGATGSEPARVKAAELSRNKSSIYF